MSKYVYVISPSQHRAGVLGAICSHRTDLVLLCYLVLKWSI